MAKYPSEIFGHYWRDTSGMARLARKKRWCPLTDSKCFKKSRLIDYPFGVCTAHIDGSEIALCPRRFLQDNIVFSDIAQHHFKTQDNILVFSEVGLSGIGNFDFVMVKHKPLSMEIEDFAVIEFQTGQTTGTGKLVDGFKDFMKDGTLKRGATYSFGINSYDIWKRTFTQILNKGIILEKWQRKIFWVVQDPIFDYFQRKFRLGDLKYSSQHSTVFCCYDLQPKGRHLQLVSTRMRSSTIDGLFNAFRKNEDIPPVERFVSRLQEKIKKDLKLGLSLGAGVRASSLDVRRPTSTGRVREEGAEYDANPQKDLF